MIDIPAEPPRLRHNRELLAAMKPMESRYPQAADQVERIPLDTSKLPPFAYNPSIARINGKTWMSFRYHFGADYRTRIAMSQIVDGIAQSPQDLPMTGYSLEDARLFTFHGETWISWVESNFEGQASPKSIVKYAQLEHGFKLGRIYQVKAGDNDFSGMQKNWCFFESDENLFCVYRSEPDYCVFQIQGDTVINEYKTLSRRWPYGPIRGGNIVGYGDKLLRFFHSRTEFGSTKRETRYYVGAALMERVPPFSVLKVSQRPIIYGSELPKYDCFHFKPGVVFPTGALNDARGWIVSVGINDAACHLIRAWENDLNL